ncbi:hypothetical protein BDV18DRAFT_154130 [Aspergillus unguis]
MTSKYAAAHEKPNGPDDTRPTALQVIEDNALEGKLSGKVVLITGCSSGIGVETARALYRTGATLYATARDVEKAKAALSDLEDHSRVHVLQLDLSSLDLVRHLFQSSSPVFSSRTIILLSCAHQAGPVHFRNLTLKGKYEPWKVYGQSKTANIYIAREIEKRYGSDDQLKQVWADGKKLAKTWKSPEQGTAKTVLAAISPELEGKGGLYLEDTQVARPPGTGLAGYADWAYSEDGPGRLWDISLELLKLV